MNPGPDPIETMNDSFAIIAEFLDKYGAEVEGRGARALPADIRQQLATLAEGKMDARAREELALLLKDHPDLVSELARVARELRPPSDRQSR